MGNSRYWFRTVLFGKLLVAWLLLAACVSQAETPAASDAVSSAAAAVKAQAIASNNEAIDWNDIRPSTGQTRRVFVTRLPEAEVSDDGNSVIDVELQEEVALPRLTRLGKQATRADQNTANFPARTLYIDLGHLSEDRDKYIRDIEKSSSISRVEGRERLQLKYNKPDFSTSNFKPDFPAGTKVLLDPSYLGSPQKPDDKIISQCLMINDLNVVNDARASNGGKWSFGYLMRQLANEAETGIRPEEFTERWLSNWQHDLEINGFSVENRREGMERLILKPWPRKDGKLDLDSAPFRLLAIVSRLDLRNNLVLGAERIGGAGAGEARFVYCAVDENGAPLAFTVIFEYGIKKANFAGVRDWAERWYALKDLDISSDKYREELEKITELFTRGGADPESPPNRSALSQLRTNEIALVVPPSPSRPIIWEIREFRLDASNTGLLTQVTVKQTPDLDYNGQRYIGQFVNDRESDIINELHRVPVHLKAADTGTTLPFVGASATTAVDMAWDSSKDAPIKNLEARHLFSLATCSGCHAAETFPKVGPKFAGDRLDADVRPPHFTHIRPRMHDKPAQLSKFLTGEGNGKDFVLPDPVSQVERRFGDLPRRADDLHDLVNYGWYYELHRLPMQFQH